MENLDADVEEGRDERVMLHSGELRADDVVEEEDGGVVRREPVQLPSRPVHQHPAQGTGLGANAAGRSRPGKGNGDRHQPNIVSGFIEMLPPRRTEIAARPAGRHPMRPRDGRC